MSPTVKAAVYARISSDPDGLALGVQRQVDDCTREAVRRGWQVARTYIDNDVSATSGRRRPEYERMLTDIRGGRLTGLVVWDVDRLTRTPRELEDIIDLADRLGLALASVGGEIDLSTPQGRMTARIKGSVARHETEQQSRRLKRKFQERAESGRPHSFAAYGYRRVIELDDRGARVGSRDELVPEQADTIREAARLLLAGVSLRAVAAQLNAAGSTTARGLPWVSATLKQVMVRERNAGRRTHLGQVIGQGQWPPIYDDDTHDRVVALLTDPGRKSTKGSTRRHMLTGIAVCGLCGAGMVVNVGRVVAGEKRQPPAYTCSGCTRVRRKQAAVDETVSAVIVARLSRPDALAALTAGSAADVEANRGRMAALNSRLDTAADQYADGVLTATQLRRITDRLRPQIDELRATLSSSLAVPELLTLAGSAAAENWAAAPLDVQRAVIEALCTVTILPVGSGRRFDPASVQVSPKG